MDTKTLLMAATSGALLFSAQIASPQETAAPRARADVKAETRSAEKAGKLVPAGQGPTGDKDAAFKSTKTRAQRKAETREARREGELEPTGEAAGLKEERAEDSAPSTTSRALRKAQTRELEKAGKLTPAGQGPDAPRK
jgi:hypothetical protein